MRSYATKRSAMPMVGRKRSLMKASKSTSNCRTFSTRNQLPSRINERKRPIKQCSFASKPMWKKSTGTLLRYQWLIKSKVVISIGSKKETMEKIRATLSRSNRLILTDEDSHSQIDSLSALSFTNRTKFQTLQRKKAGDEILGKGCRQGIFLQVQSATL